MRTTKRIAAIMAETASITLFFEDQSHAELKPKDVVLMGNNPVLCENLRPDDIIVCEETKIANENAAVS